MPRGPRLDEPGTLHHIIMRGIEKGSIVLDNADRGNFLRRMSTLAETTETVIYAFALMDNHVHILLRSGPSGISTFMRRLLSGYAQYFNKRHKRVGHLFQNRYKSIVCEEEAYFEKLVAYIHLNPLRAGLVDTVEQLSTYPWTGHAAIMNKIRYDWLDRSYVLGFFGSDDRSAKKAYLAYLFEEMGQQHETDLSGGGLVRSYGGWANVHSLRKKGQEALGDERILGTDSFVRKILEEAEHEELEDQPLTPKARVAKLRSEIAQACLDAGVTEAFFRSGSRSRDLPAIRNRIAEKFVFTYGLTLAETARWLGVSTSAVSNMLKKHQRSSPIEEKP